MKKNTLFIITLLLCSLPFLEMEAQRMISFQRLDNVETSPTTMHETDPTTAAVSAIGLTGVGQITAAAYDPTSDILYASHGGGGCCPVSGFAGCVLIGDDATGAVTIQACDTIYGGNDNMAGIAFDSSGNMFGLLLVVNAGPSTDSMHLVSVDKVTGEISLIGGTNDWASGNGMAFAANDTLYSQNVDDGFGWIDTTTGILTPIGFTTVGFPSVDYDRSTDMAYDFVNDIMYATLNEGGGGGGTALATVDLATGTFTFVGSFPDYINSIAINSSIIVTTLNDTVCDTYDFAGRP